MANEITYYKHIEPQGPSGIDFEKLGHGYRGFLCERDPAYLLWTVKYDDGTPVPLALRDRKWTDIPLTHAAIDDFLESEKKKQEAATAKQ